MRAKIFGDFTFVNKKVPKLKNKGHFIITTLKVEKAKVVLFLRFGHYLYPKIENRVRKFYYIKTLPDVKTSCTMATFGLHQDKNILKLSRITQKNSSTNVNPQKKLSQKEQGKKEGDSIP